MRLMLPDRRVHHHTADLVERIWPAPVTDSFLTKENRTARIHFDPGGDRRRDQQEIGQGKGNHDIATRLAISPRTVDAHRVNIRKKLGLADGTELTRYAVRWIKSGR